MTRNWLRFSCFGLIFVFLFTWINLALRQPLLRWDNFQQLPENSIDVLFMGNSHSLYAFQPQIVNDVMPVNSYSIGVEGENIYISYYELREILKTQNPKLIVLETFTLNLARPLKPAILFGYTDTGFWDLNKLAVLTRFLPYDIAYSAFPALHRQVDWNNAQPFLTRLLHPMRPMEGDVSPALGATIISDTMSKHDYQAAFSLPEALTDYSSAENERYLEKFVDLCRQNNIQLILVTTPVVKVSGDLLFKYYVPFDVASAVEKDQLDWIAYDPSRFNELHYCTPDHVSSFGSAIVSLEVAREISERMGVPMDEGKLEEYRAFYFSGYSLDQDGNNYTLTLTPQDASAEVNYKFMLIQTDVYNVAASTDWQTDSTFQFSLPDRSEYYVQVLISHPNLDYEMGGVFYINKAAKQ